MTSYLQSQVTSPCLHQTQIGRHASWRICKNACVQQTCTKRAAAPVCGSRVKSNPRLSLPSTSFTCNVATKQSECLQCAAVNLLSCQIFPPLCRYKLSSTEQLLPGCPLRLAPPAPQPLMLLPSPSMPIEMTLRRRFRLCFFKSRARHSTTKPRPCLASFTTSFVVSFLQERGPIATPVTFQQLPCIQWGHSS